MLGLIYFLGRFSIYIYIPCHLAPLAFSKINIYKYACVIYKNKCIYNSKNIYNLDLHV